MLSLYVKSILLHNIMVTVIYVSPVNRKDFQLKEYISAKITVCLTMNKRHSVAVLQYRASSIDDDAAGPFVLNRLDRRSDYGYHSNSDCCPGCCLLSGFGHNRCRFGPACFHHGHSHHCRYRGNVICCQTDQQFRGRSPDH